jgi:hypothetical protein
VVKWKLSGEPGARPRDESPQRLVSRELAERTSSRANGRFRSPAALRRREGDGDGCTPGYSFSRHRALPARGEPVPRRFPTWGSSSCPNRRLPWGFTPRVVEGQATLGGGWMPWGQEPKKGAAHRDRPRGAASMRRSVGTRMRQRDGRDGPSSRLGGKVSGGTETS